MKKGFARCALSVLVVVSTHSIISATPIEFTFAGVGSGHLDGQSFDSAGFLIRLIADTSNIHTLDENINTLRGASTIHIDGIGDAKFTIPTRVFSNQSGDVFDPPSPCVGFSNDDPKDQGDDFVDLADRQLAGFRLSAPIGPITSDRIAAVDQFHATTSQGLLNFEQIDSVTFTASTSAAVIPLPRAVLSGAVLGGLVGAWGLVRRARARRRHELLTP